MSTSSLTDGHGLLRPWERDRSFTLESRPPSPGLERLVDRHWIVRWDLRGRAPFQQETLPHPSINLVADEHGARVWGVPTRRDVRLLRGEGWAIGTKLRPGAFTAITGIEACSITDGSIPVPAVLAAAWPVRLVASGDDPLGAATTAVESRLAPYADVDDPALELVGAVIASMHAHFINDFRLVTERSPAECLQEALAA